jgi:hypothetical protein
MIYLEVIPESIQLVKMDDEVYFSEEYSDYISNSKLSLINPEEGGSPEKFREGLNSKYSESLELGSSIHCMLLQPDRYEISEIRKPTGKLGLFAENFYLYRKDGYNIEDSIRLSSEKSDYYSGKLTDKRVKTAIRESMKFYLNRIKLEESLDKVTLFLSSPMAYKFEKCKESILNNSKFLKVLYPEGISRDPEVFNEYAILCEIKLSGDIDKTVKVKAKLDNFTIDHEQQVVTLNDVKSTGKPISFFMGGKNKDGLYVPGSFEKYRYYRQVGMYLWLLQNALRLKDYKYKVNILAVETIPDFKNRIFHISSKWIDKGLREFKELLILAAYECG